MKLGSVCDNGGPHTRTLSRCGRCATVTGWEAVQRRRRGKMGFSSTPAPMKSLRILSQTALLGLGFPAAWGAATCVLP